MQSRLMAVLHQPGIQVAGHTVMRTGIRTVGSDVHFDKIVALQVIVFRSRGSGHSRPGQHDDAVVVRTDTNLIFRTYHAIALHPAQLGFLDGKTFVAIIQFATQRSHHHLLSGCHVRRTAHNLYWFPLAEVHRTYVHVV